MKNISAKGTAMTHARILITICLMTGALLVMCACRSVDDEDVVTLTEQDHQQTVTLGLDQTVEIVLDSNPSTGYAWEFSASDPPILRLDTREYIPDEPDNPRPGSGGRDVFTFTPLSTGEAHIVMYFEQPGDFVPTRTFKVAIIIE